MGIIPDQDKCAAVMSQFLTAAMPEVEKCLPDWNSVEHRSSSQGAGQPVGQKAAQSAVQLSELPARPAVKTGEALVRP